MEDTKPKKSRKRHHCSPDVPSKRRMVEAPTAQEQPPQPAKKPVVRHSTSDKLLKRLGLFLSQKCSKLKLLSYKQPICWLKEIDDDLLIRGYQDERFLSSSSVVFLYMMCRELISPEVNTIEELKASLLTCFYVSFSYIGCETTYPSVPFMVGSSFGTFWDRCLSYTRLMSFKMIKINENPLFYRMMLNELKAVGKKDGKELTTYTKERQ